MIYFYAHLPTPSRAGVCRWPGVMIGMMNRMSAFPPCPLGPGSQAQLGPVCVHDPAKLPDLPQNPSIAQCAIMHKRADFSPFGKLYHSSPKNGGILLIDPSSETFWQEMGCKSNSLISKSVHSMKVGGQIVADLGIICVAVCSEADSQSLIDSWPSMSLAM